MNHSHTRYRYLAGTICLAAVMAVQLGCGTKTNQPEIAKVEKKATPESPATKKAIEPPTDPIAKTETAAKAPPEFVNATFEAPFRLMVGDSPVNTAAKQMYPSPAMFDVDNDGQSELIVGDIFGGLNVYENQNDGDGDPIWSSHTALTSTDGEAIKVSNW